MKRLILLVFVFLWAIQGMAYSESGAVVSKGLELTISQTDVKSKSPVFLVKFKNVGVEDFVLNLGVLLGNGKQYPTQLRFILADPNGSVRELFEMGPPAVAGSVDDYLVPIKVGSSYTLVTSLDQCWNPSTKNFGINISKGKYHVQSSYSTEGAKYSQGRMAASYLEHIWTGQIKSNVLQFIQE